MGTTSEKLTYLNTTKEKIRNSINLTGANLTSEDTFRSYATKLKKGYIDIINNGIDTLYNNFPKVSGIGSNLSLAPTYEAPMKLNEIQGSTLQDGTPTPDTPVEIQSVTGLQKVNVCGKNLFDKSTIIENKYIDASGNLVNDNSNFVGDYILIDNTKSYYASQNAGGVIRVGYYDINKTFISRQLISANYGSLTIPNNTVYVRLSCYNQSLDTLQLEKGSTATEYEPYKGNTYEVNLGKNLLNVSQESYTFTAGVNSGQPIISTINLKANTKYYVSYTIDTQMTSNTRSTPFLSLGNNKYYQYETNNVNLTTGRKVWEYTPTTSGTYSFGYWSHTPDVDLTVSKFMISKSSDTSYSPYFTPIELNKIGTYQDRIYKNSGKWYLEKQIGKVVLNGNEAWGYDSNSLFFVSSNAISNYSRSNNIPYCDYYKGVSNVNAGGNINNNEIAFNNNVSNNRLYVKNTNITSASDFKTWLSTHNTEVLYVLATPEYTEITNTELIEDLETLYTAKSQEGTTNISITSEDLEMILNVSALKGDA